MEFMDVIYARRSVRRFRSDPIAPEMLHSILEAGRLSPSGGNSQNWFFGVVEDHHIKTQLAEAAGKQHWIATAPVVIAFCTSIAWNLRELPEDDYALQINKSRFTIAFLLKLFLKA